MFIIDHEFALDQIDFLENYDALARLVVPDTVLKYLNKKHLQSYFSLKALIDRDDQRQLYYLYNENFEKTYVDKKSESNSISLLRKQTAKVLYFY